MTKQQLKDRLETCLRGHGAESLEQSTLEQRYGALLDLVAQECAARPQNAGEKRLYYISAEFLMGKLLSNNLISLGLYRPVQELLEEAGYSLAQLEDREPEPSLGNGGLGRLAACFLDSIATLGLNGVGLGLCYHFGLFRQQFEDNAQQEQPNPWLEQPGILRDTGRRYPVQLGEHRVEAALLELDVAGYGQGRTVLRLFDLTTVDESLVREGIQFDKTDVEHNLTLFLYPDDNDREGRLLRVYQQYFMVSASAQHILEEQKALGHDLRRLWESAVIQINDTHPSMVIPELIRLLMGEGLTLEEATQAVSRSCAYTNHTILAEALEKWPLSFLEEAAPAILPILRQLDARAKERYPQEELAIIDQRDRVHMARLDLHYGFSVNGVAALHTGILQETELRDFYRIYPEKFHNVTNGITFRRWLLHCNPGLARLLEALIGDGFHRDAGELQKLLAYREDPQVLDRLLELKQHNKAALCGYLRQSQGVRLDPDSVFDIQIKRLHQYKRQQMNALYLIHKYLEIREGRLPARPVTALFGAKAAPAYTLAKDIIHLILCLQQLINGDPQVSPWLQVVMVENYNVTSAEKLIPACDISEQISLASQEASGTGNMKLMLNGAVTLGTMDGANVEISSLVGYGSFYAFGKSSREVLDLYQSGSYCAKTLYYRYPEIARAVDFIIGKELIQLGDPLSLCRLYKDLVDKDWFMTLLDTRAYFAAKDQMLEDYEDRRAWAKKMLTNIAMAGYFSSDRSIADYNREIWKL